MDAGPAPTAVRSGPHWAWRLPQWLIVACLALMVLLVFVNVVLRYLFNTGITLSEELSRWLFVWLILVGAVVALRDDAHLGSEFVISRLPPRGRRLCLVLGQLLTLAILALLLRGAWALVLVNYPVRAPASGASMAIVYLPCALFAALGLPVVGARLLRTLSGAPLPEPPADEAGPQAR